MTNAAPLKILRDEDLRERVCVTIGTRPGVVMLSPVIRELERRGVSFFVLHTDQHYSHNMDQQLLDELGLPEPDHRLTGVREAKLHGAQTAAMLAGCEQVLLAERPRLLIVGGDANTNLAAALAARKLHIPVGHVEAGERSGDWRMPEEHNRVIIDHIADYLFATNAKGRDNLVADNVRGRILVTGNPIVDASHQNLEIARRRSVLRADLGLREAGYLVLTVHREENVDSPETLAGILEGIEMVAERFGEPIVFPAHPRTRQRLIDFELDDRARSIGGLILLDAVGYLDFLELLSGARLALTDSGGVQQESCILGVSCVTLRDSTEWTETVEVGANALAGTEPALILRAAEQMLSVPGAWQHSFGDGRAAERIVDRAVVALAPGRLDELEVRA